MSTASKLEDLKLVQKIGDKAAQKLLANGYTLFRLSHAEPGKIASILGCSVKEAKMIIADATAKLIEKTGELPKPMTAKSYQEFLDERIVWYSSGSQKIDELVGGGFRSSSIVGLSGPLATGKTQMILTTLADCICNKGKYAMFVETELDTFDPLRVEEIAKARGWINKYDPEKLIVVDAYKVKDVGTQFYYYEVLYDMAKEHEWDVGLFAVDSFNSLFQRKFKGRETFPDRKQEFVRHFNYLETIAKDFNSLIMLTFQVISVPVSPEESRGAMDTVLVRSWTGTNFMPWGGNLVFHLCGTWLSLEKTHSKGIYKAHLFDSSRVKIGDCLFQITEKGISDLPPALAKRFSK
jgi:RecA/RadA recombinase